MSGRAPFDAAMGTLGWDGCRLRVAATFEARARGMIGCARTSRIAMAFPRCRSVHTCFMTVPLDIAFIDREGSVLAVYKDVGPWRVLAVPGAWGVLERVSRAG